MGSVAPSIPEAYTYRGAAVPGQGQAGDGQYLHKSDPTNLVRINTMEKNSENRDRSIKTDKEGSARK